MRFTEKEVRQLMEKTGQQLPAKPKRQKKQPPWKQFGYDSREEELFAREAWLALRPNRPYPLDEMRYHPFRLHLPGGDYSPDFYIRWKTGTGYRSLVIEVKGSKKQKNYRAARRALKEAAAAYPEWEFIEARYDGESWELERINGKT